jgi:hypothetical protein
MGTHIVNGENGDQSSNWDERVEDLIIHEGILSEAKFPEGQFNLIVIGRVIMDKLPDYIPLQIRELHMGRLDRDVCLPHRLFCQSVRFCACCRGVGNVAAGNLSHIFWPIGLKHISSMCFRMSGISVVDLRRTHLRRIGEQAFEDCERLRELHLPICLKDIGGECFARTPLLCVSMDCCRCLRSIGPRAFAMCTELRRLVFPSRAMGIGEGVHDGCEALEELEVGTAQPWRGWSSLLLLSDKSSGTPFPALTTVVLHSAALRGATHALPEVMRTSALGFSGSAAISGTEARPLRPLC